MNINELKYGQIKELMKEFNGDKVSKSTLKQQIGEKVIIRTYSAGVWFGELEEKEGNEVYLKKARRMWRWWAKESISLSGVAKHGIKEDKSQIAPAVDRVWLEAIEILSLTQTAIESIESVKNAEAQ